MREALRQSQSEKAAFHHLDKLDGEVGEAFYRRNVSQWREEQAHFRSRIEQHEKADQNYVEQGIRLLELARNAQESFRTRSQEARAALLGFILPDSTLQADRVAPAFKPPFDIIHRIAQEARRATQGTKKQAPANFANACPILLPRFN